VAAFNAAPVEAAGAVGEGAAALSTLFTGAPAGAVLEGATAMPFTGAPNVGARRPQVPRSAQVPGGTVSILVERGFFSPTVETGRVIHPLPPSQMLQLQSPLRVQSKVFEASVSGRVQE